jgi:hypothetical protein
MELGQTNTSCPNSCDGSFSYDIGDFGNGGGCETSTVTITGPNNFAYTNTGHGGDVITGLCAGTYFGQVHTDGLCYGYDDNFTFTINSDNTPVLGGTESATVCSGSYAWNGSNYSQTGIYADTLQGAAAGGCDSIAYLNLAVVPGTTNTLYDTLLVGQTIRIGANIYSQAGSYIDTLTGVYGCDSIIHLYLAIDTPTFFSLFDTICQGASVSLGGRTYIHSGTYGDTLTNSAGGDSIVTLHLFVINITSTNIFDTICQGSSFLFAGQTLSTQGIYRDTLQSVSGCDSILILNLNVHQTSTTNIYDTMCQGSSFLFAGYSLTAQGIYRDTLQSVIHGCDSFITLHLTVYPTSQVGLFDTICQGASVAIGSHRYSQAGTYSDTLNSIHGCDSIVTLHLSFYTTGFISLYDTICRGHTVSVGTHIHRQTGFYIDTLSGIHGCDSIVSLGLFVLPLDTFSIYENICQGQSANIGNHSYSSSGNYHDTLTSARGCDSIVNLHLTVYPRYTKDLYDTICSGSSISFAGQTLSTAGTFNNHLQSRYGCDSLIVMHLFVKPTFSIYQFDTICSNSSFTFLGHSYSQAGIYIDTLLNGSGCNNLITLNLTVNPASSISLYDTLVTGDTLHIAGHAYTRSGIYYDTLSNRHGCDSLITLYLYVATTTTISHLFDTVCQGFSVAVGNHTYTVSGTYIDTLTGTYGGDSIVTLHLTINQARLSNINDTISQGGSVTVGTHTYTHAGTYVDTLMSMAGCDSIVALHLVVVTGITGIESSIQSINIYPNPTQGTVHLSIDMRDEKDVELSVSDLLGQNLMDRKLKLHAGKNEDQFILENSVSGIYILKLTIDGRSIYYRILLDK